MQEDWQMGDNYHTDKYCKWSQEETTEKLQFYSTDSNDKWQTEHISSIILSVLVRERC